jgi:hypothetical protein
MPNLKNHTGLRPIVLSGDQGDIVTYARNRTFKFFTKDLPISTGRLANYLVGFLVTVAGSFTNNETTAECIDWDDVARGLFESCEFRDTMLGKPISHNYYRGEFWGLGGFVGNGMQVAVPQPPLLGDLGNGSLTQRHSYYIPASSMLGMKGHHTCQLAALFDRGVFEVKTASSGVLGSNVPLEFAGTIEVTALLVAEPELRLGPGTQFVRYGSTLGATQTKHVVDALGVTSSLQNVEEGAGIAFLAWMSGNRGLGGSWNTGHHIEYINFPSRGLDQLTHLDACFVDYLSSCNINGNAHVTDSGTATNGTPGDAGPWPNNGCLYGPAYTGEGNGLLDANFIPLISPKRFLEVSKLQSFQGTVDLHAKYSANWDGAEDVFFALQYHSWTPAQVEEVLKKIITSGLAQTVWGTNDLVPSTKVVNKQPAGTINKSKTRYFATTWVPKEVVANPPSQSAKA